MDLSNKNNSCPLCSEDEACPGEHELVDIIPLRKKISALHRRAQKGDAAASRLVKVRDNMHRHYNKLLKHRRDEVHWHVSHDRKALRLIREAGISVDWNDVKEGETALLSVIKKLILERDELKRSVSRRALEKVASLVKGVFL